MSDTAPFAPFSLPAPPAIPDRRVSIADCGAVEGGTTLCTQAIRAAIAACAAEGGGQVVVPAGTWLTGAIHLADRIELHLEQGAVLRFSQDPDDYLPVVFTQRGGIRCYNYSPFIYARGCSDVAITGSGELDGRGEAWWPWKHAQPGMKALFEMGAAGVPVEQRIFGTREAGVRPAFIQPIECRNVLIEGVTIRNSPSWTLHPVWCENIMVRGVSIHNPPEAHNTDGIDPDGCRNVLIEHCHVDTGDDGICLKAGRDADGRAVGIPCENVLVRHCTVKRGHGGIVIGSEVSGGVCNMLAHDCTFDGTDAGIRLKSRPGRGGGIRNVRCERIRMHHIRRQAVIVTLSYSGEPLEPPLDDIDHVPQVCDILLRDIHCESADESIQLNGLPGHPLRRITLDQIDITAQRQMSCIGVEDLSMSGMVLKSMQPEPMTE
jgi:polygalacturonase